MSNPKDLFMLCESMQDEKELANLDRKKYKANIKYDGERVMCVKLGEEVILFNRRGNIITSKFSEIVNELKTIQQDFAIDGEIISLDNDFTKLQSRALTKDKTKIARLEQTTPVKFMVFDAISIDSRIIMREPLKERINRLVNLLFPNQFSYAFKHIELVEYEDINNCLARAIESNGEGIVIKDMDSFYECKRSKSWYKHKLFKETTLTITAFTDNPKGIRATDSEGNAVQIAGFQSQEVKTALEQKGYANINVQYLSKTKENKLRFISYRGLAQ